MSGLPWIRFDTSFPDGPKVLDLLGLNERNLVPSPEGKMAGFVFACSIAYSGKHGTDGFIPYGALPRVNGNEDDAARLVDAELWQPAPGGWRIPHWSEYQQSTESQAATRAAKKAGSRKGNCVRWHGPECGCWQDPQDPPPADPGPGFRPRIV